MLKWCSRDCSKSSAVKIPFFLFALPKAKIQEQNCKKEITQRVCLLADRASQGPRNTLKVLCVGFREIYWQKWKYVTHNCVFIVVLSPEDNNHCVFVTSEWDFYMYIGTLREAIMGQVRVRGVQLVAICNLTKGCLHILHTGPLRLHLKDSFFLKE